MSAISPVTVMDETTYAVRFRRADGSTHESTVSAHGLDSALVNARRERDEWIAAGWPVDPIDAVAAMVWRPEANAWLPDEWVLAADLDAEADAAEVTDPEPYPVTFRDVGVTP